MSSTTAGAGTDAGFVLHHEVLSGAEATRTALVLHGALGSGQNFRGFVRKLMSARPDYAFVLVDLRCHGQSHPAPAPQTMAAAAEDLQVLAQALSQTRPELPPVTTLVGHSLGGKVALMAADKRRELASQLFILDSNPGTQDPDLAHEIHTVIKGVRSIEMPVASRKAVVDALRQRGFSSGLANWMTTNLTRRGDDLVWTFDLDGIEQLLTDYFSRDLWPFLETPPAGIRVELVIAGDSDRWSAEMRQRAEALEEGSGTHVSVIPDAGHWLHVDNPQALLDLMTTRLETG